MADSYARLEALEALFEALGPYTLFEHLAAVAAPEDA